MLFSSHCREALHFDERHAFGEIGGLMLSLIQEPGNEDVPFTFVLLARLIHSDPSEIGYAILTGGFDRISGMSSPPPSVLLGG
jgi:hypothetical protein